MNRSKKQTLLVFAVSFALYFISLERAPAEDQKRPPNFVILLCDNLGYGDVGCFGSTKHRTPNIDRMAKEGVRLTSFYSASGVCTPSRAGLMTGCYPRRVGLAMTDPDGIVLRPVSPNGLHREEVTIAEVLKRRGYVTTCIGKWHLGDQPPFLPTRQGFDSYFGIPYSDDMTPRPNQIWPPLPLMQDEQVIEAPVDRNLLTKRYTERAVEFIEENKDHPFFLYLPHAMPGSTKNPFASERFLGKSANGTYGDSVEEIDWSTGQILDALKRFKIDDRTLVVWTSDNGAPRRNPAQGSNLPLRGWGYSTMEGGMRVPCIIRWPRKIPAGQVCDELSTMMDLLPTFAKLAGGESDVPAVDGHDIWPLLANREGAKSPYSAFYYYHRDQLHAVRSGRWKLHLASSVAQNRLVEKPNDKSLFLVDLDADIGESTNVAAENPAVVTELQEIADQARTDLGDGAKAGKNERTVGRVSDPKPQVLP